VLYLVAYAANFVILYLLPRAEVDLFLKNYTLYNTLASLFVTLLLAGSKGWLYRIRVFWLFYIVTFLMLVLSASYKSKPLLYACYPIIIILSDYFASQNMSLRAINLYRAFSFLTISVFWLNVDFSTQVFIRSILISLPSFFCVWFSKEFKALKIQSTLKYILIIYASYSAVLFIIVRLSFQPVEQKYWYMGVQIGLALVLKLMDFKARGELIKSVRLKQVVYLANGIILIFVNYMHLSMLASLLYLAGFCGLLYADKVYVK
jgi:hypothetical protein